MKELVVVLVQVPKSQVAPSIETLSKGDFKVLRIVELGQVVKSIDIAFLEAGRGVSALQRRLELGGERQRFAGGEAEAALCVLHECCNLFIAITSDGSIAWHKFAAEADSAFRALERELSGVYQRLESDGDNEQAIATLRGTAASVAALYKWVSSRLTSTTS
jgi:hypothetical protein